MALIQKYENIFSKEDIEQIFSFSEVKKAKIDIDNKSYGCVYFSIPLTSLIIDTLKEKFNLDFSNKKSIPMRWIKGDTYPHIDRGISDFKKTHLIYLNDNPGKFIIEGNTYPINKGYGYVFDESLKHETIETGIEPRLLMGPMSEEGFAVGGGTGIDADGATDIIYFRYNSSLNRNEYRINNNLWSDFVFPVAIQNTNIDPTNNILKIIFTTDITLYNFFDYFICSSDGIQFGSESLNSDGSRPKINIEDVNSYPGLIFNGNSSTNGFNNIYIFNLEIYDTGVGNTYLSDEAGWFGQDYFGKSALNNYIVNCYSRGSIPENGGGIIGGNACDGSVGPGSLYIIGCSSSGNMGPLSGGIIGFNAGQNGSSVTCQSCWSTGVIGTNGGGIFGAFPGISEGLTNAINCYSTGIIGTNAGGIYGAFAGEYAGDNNATGCYSRGNIGTDGGGIYGSDAGVGSGTCIATNCYSNGSIATTGNGIFGTTGATVFTNNCYSSNGSWSSSSANLNLTGVPSSSVIGTTWVATATNQPYELLNIGYTPYSINNILTTTTPILNRTYSSTIKQGKSSTSGIISGLSYQILDKSGGNSSSYSTISINSSTGQISTKSSTKTGTYTLYIRNTGSYNITEYTLIVTKSSSKKKKRKNKVRVYFNNLQGSTTIIKCKKGKCKKDTFDWC